LNTNTTTLLEEVYQALKQASLICSAQAFSADYLGKNRNWYAFQAHHKRDFSVSTAIACLRAIRLYQTTQPLNPAHYATLTHIAALLLTHLSEVHSIAEVLR
jgi:hypothetical protein